MDQTAATPPAQILYIPHGGGPLPLMGEPSHQLLVEFLQALHKRLRRPKAIVLISAHWEAKHPSLTAGAQPDLLYDYSGFPEETYQLSYPAPGAPLVAGKIHALLEKAGFHPQLEQERGFDHGMFIPLKLMYPQADIPCVQLSLLSGLSARAHLDLGKALAPLKEEPLLVIGSGFSFHNMRAFFSATEGPDAGAEAFNRWLIDTMSSEDLLPEEREQQLEQWHLAPQARYAHPREEHLLPLHVCYGLAQSKATVVFDDRVLGKQTCGLLWG